MGNLLFIERKFSIIHIVFFHSIDKTMHTTNMHRFVQQRRAFFEVSERTAAYSAGTIRYIRRINLNENSVEVYNIFNDSEMLAKGQEFAQMMLWYRCAAMEVETKLNVLNQEFSLQYDRNPFESIKTRIKSPASIINKMQKKGLEVSVAEIWDNLHDIAGVRVVCSFQEDIYKLAKMLCSQDDVSLMKIKDYIKNPKPNGYRSLHLIIAIPIFLSEQKQYVKVEVQFRTIAMDFWASLEHKMKYKKNIKNPDQIAERLYQCAENIAAIDVEMQTIRNLIEKE